MHFIGLLFSENLDLLENYYERLEVEPYITYTKEEIIDVYIKDRKRQVKFRKEKIAANDPRSSEYKQWLDSHKRYTKKMAWQDIVRDYAGNIDEDGNIYERYNPNGFWDWYTIGGRWSGYLPLKERNENGEIQYTDEATVGEVDWEEYRKTKKSPYCFINCFGEWLKKDDSSLFESTLTSTKTKEFEENLYKTIQSYLEDTPVIAIDFHI